jgi:hypothetical protein
MIDPNRVIREHLKALEKYEAYKKECREKGEEILPFEIWNKREIDRAWMEGLKQAGFIIFDLGRTKIVTWMPEEKEKEKEKEKKEK